MGWSIFVLFQIFFLNFLCSSVWAQDYNRFFNSELRQNLQLIKDHQRQYPQSNLEVAPASLEGLSAFNLARVNGIINAAHTGGLDGEALEKVNRRLGKDLEGSSCGFIRKTKGVSENIMRQSRSLGIKNVGQAKEVPQARSLKIIPRFRFRQPNFVDMSNTLVKIGRNYNDYEVLGDSHRTIELKPSFSSWIFGADYGKIKRCIQRIDFVVGLRGCQLEAPKSSCQGTLKCQLRTHSGKTNSLTIPNANCQGSCNSPRSCLNTHMNPIAPPDNSTYRERETTNEISR